jgi:PBSX family phage terminase large subunit
LEEEKAYLRRQYKGLWYQRFIEGQWVQAEGAIYDFFETEGLYSHVLPFAPHEAREYILGVDYGTTNPCAFVLIGMNLNKPYPNMWVEDEYYYDSKIHQRQKTDAEYAADLVDFIKFRNVRAIYLDPSAASFRAELLKSGVNGLFEAENDVENGIRLVSNMFSQGVIKVTRKCKNLIEEFQSYVWDPKCTKTGVDKPLKQNDHALDALRYAIYTHYFNKSGTRLTPNDLDRLQREAYGQSSNLPAFFQDPQDFRY